MSMPMLPLKDMSGSLALLQQGVYVNVLYLWPMIPPKAIRTLVVWAATRGHVNIFKD